MQDFLLGDSNWFGGSLPARLDHEVDAPEAWSGWRRQRLSPGLTGFLFPAAWSALLLAAGLIPLLLHSLNVGIGAPIRLGLGLTLGAFVMLWLTAAARAVAQVEGSPVKMLVWNLVRTETILLGVLIYIVDLNPIGLIATFGLLIAVPLWFSQMVRIATVLAWPPGRWLLPVAHVDVGLAEIAEGWETESNRWARRPLARRSIPAGFMGNTSLEMVLFGLREGNLDYIAIHLVHPSGALLDPFVGPSIGDEVPFPSLGPRFADVPSPVAIREHFGAPPVSPVVAKWPSAMIPAWESEEE